MTQVPDGEQACARVAALLDDLRARATIPAGTRGRTYAILDTLRAARAPAWRVQAAERIALILYSLEWARLQKSGEQEEALWRRLDACAADWACGGEEALRAPHSDLVGGVDRQDVGGRSGQL